MVDISERLEAISELVDAGKYFCISRPHQYGKSTTLAGLKKVLTKDYVVVSLDLQAIGQAGFATEETFVQEFCRLLWKRRKFDGGLDEELLERLDEWRGTPHPTACLGEVFELLFDWCERCVRGVVLMVDEVDRASSHRVFLDFLKQLRAGYLSREQDEIKAFQSVILAGTADVRQPQATDQPEDALTEGVPWNIASDLTLDLSLSEEGIQGMLAAYEADHRTGMDVAWIAKQLHAYTCGYPYLVSRLCQMMDGPVSEALGSSRAWTGRGIDEAIKIVLADGDDALLGSLMGALADLPQLKKLLRDVLMRGDAIGWLPHDPGQRLLRTYGFIRNNNNTVAISNRIFEMLLHPYVLE